MTTAIKEKKATRKAKAPKESALEAAIFDAKGSKAGNIALPEKLFGAQWNADLVHQVMHSMMSSARQPIAHTKTRGEVRGGGKKPWRQKGTGRARHGSTRSPIWVGGGIAHGPRNDKNYDRKINKSMKAKAFAVALSKKWKDGQVLFIDSLDFKAPKTAEAEAILVAVSKNSGLEKLATKPKNAAYIALSSKNTNAQRSFRNISSVDVEEVRNMNLLDLLNHAFVIIENPVESLKFLENKIS